MRAYGFFIVFVFLILIIFSGCEKAPSYPSNVTLELVSKQNMDMFQAETTKPIFTPEVAYNHDKYPWSTEIQIFYLGKEPLTGFYQYVGEKTGGMYSFKGVDFSHPPTSVYGTREVIPHDQEQIVLSYGWEINGKLEKGKLVYKVIAHYDK